MLTYLTTNLFTSPAQTLVNTVNTVGVMGKGIALEFKKLYPAMFGEYQRRCKAGDLAVGKLFIYRTSNKTIVNFPTKKHWRNPSKVEYLDAGLSEFVKQYSNYGIASVSFPQLGCGNGELDWESDVQPLMERYLKPLPIPVYIHLYPTAPNFVPERLDQRIVQQLQSEREIIAFDQVWRELESIISAQGMSNGSAPQVAISDEMVSIKQKASGQAIVHRQDIEDLWNTLRLTGTVAENRVPEPIRADGATQNIFELLARLSYIEPIELHTTSKNGAMPGLQYHAPARQEQVVADEELVM